MCHYIIFHAFITYMLVVCWKMYMMIYPQKLQKKTTQPVSFLLLSVGSIFNDYIAFPFVISVSFIVFFFLCLKCRLDYNFITMRSPRLLLYCLQCFLALVHNDNFFKHIFWLLSFFLWMLYIILVGIYV